MVTSTKGQGRPHDQPYMHVLARLQALVEYRAIVEELLRRVPDDVITTATLRQVRDQIAAIHHAVSLSLEGRLAAERLDPEQAAAYRTPGAGHPPGDRESFLSDVHAGRRRPDQRGSGRRAASVLKQEVNHGRRNGAGPAAGAGCSATGGGAAQ